MHYVLAEKALEKIQDLSCNNLIVHWPSPEMPEQMRMILSWKKGQ